MYEPLVHVSEGLPRHTSRAAEPAVVAIACTLYHGMCYERLTDTRTGF